MLLYIALLKCSLQHFSSQTCLVDMAVMPNVVYLDRIKKNYILAINCIHFECNEHFWLCSWTSSKIWSC